MMIYNHKIYWVKFAVLCARKQAGSEIERDVSAVGLLIYIYIYIHNLCAI